MQPVAHSCSSAARSSPRRATGAYAPPTPLQDLHNLDFLELCGSQAKAGAALAVHQSTVCRSVQLMQQQFQLLPDPGRKVCRYGHNECLKHLRLAYRAHRLMGGLLRIGTDLLHQALLVGIDGVQQVPPRFRSGGHWAELVRNGLLDGAIVSSFCLERRLPTGAIPQWDGVAALPLGQLALQLLTASPDTQRVLLPRRMSMPLLHEAIEWHGYGVDQQPAACPEPAAWLKRARDRKLALPVCPELLGAGWIDAHGLTPLAEQPLLVEQLWLLLPKNAEDSRAARQCLRRLLLQISKAKTMQDLHGLQI